MFENADLIHRYTRTDAIRDGVLIDVSATAQEVGFRSPVANNRRRIAPEVRCGSARRGLPG